RDRNVTGVQTCALPISDRCRKIIEPPGYELRVDVMSISDEFNAHAFLRSCLDHGQQWARFSVVKTAQRVIQVRDRSRLSSELVNALDTRLHLPVRRARRPAR